MDKKTELAIDLGQTIYNNTIEQLRADLAKERQELSRVLKECEAHCIEHREELAAAQATIAEMRKALEDFCEYAEACNDDSPEFYRARAIIAIQCNLDALHEDRARECERLAKKSEQGMLLCNELIEEAAAHRARKEGQ